MADRLETTIGEQQLAFVIVCVLSTVDCMGVVVCFWLKKYIKKKNSVWTRLCSFLRLVQRVIKLEKKMHPLNTIHLKGDARKPLTTTTLSLRCNYVNPQALSRPKASPAVVTREGLFRGDSTCHFPALAVKHSEDLHSEDSTQRQHPINAEKMKPTKTPLKTKGTNDWPGSFGPRAPLHRLRKKKGGAVGVRDASIFTHN